MNHFSILLRFKDVPTQLVKVSPAQARPPCFRHPVGARQGWGLTASAPQVFTLLELLHLLQPPGRMGNGSSLTGPALWSRFRLWFPMCHLPHGGRGAGSRRTHRRVSVTSYLCFPSLFQTLYGYFCAKSYEIKRG